MLSRKLSGNLYEFVTSSENIYNAIYSLNSYIFEKGLLDDEDIKLYRKLQDKYNFTLIDTIIKQCSSKLKSILNGDELFNIKVYFKMKKFYEDKIEYRPTHTSDLITQICIVALLNVIVFNDTNGNRQLSDVSKLIPSNFYGNIPSIDVGSIFHDWHKKYKEYSKEVIDEYNLCKQTGEFKYEVCLDLKNFFPSINPDVIYSILLNKMKVIFQGEDQECLKVILRKLLFFNVCNISQCYKEYYNNKYCNDIVLKEKIYPSLGIPQGLPQSYYFGNICMIEISKIIEKKFSGKAYYYVDDSVIYTNSKNAINNEKFKSAISELNEEINKLFKSFIEEPKCQENKFNHYEIKIYDNGKSIVSDIQHDKKYGRNFLRQINLGVSSVSYDIVNTLDELQDETIREKTKLFCSAIEKELELTKARINNLNKDSQVTNNILESMESYLKLLKRYRKFFLYRIKIMKYSRENLKKDDLTKYYEKYKINTTEEFTIDDKKQIFEIFDEDIFAAEASLFLKFADNEEEKRDIFEKISKYEQKLADSIPKNNLYYTKCLSYNYNLSILTDFDEYKTLKLMDCKYINRNKKYSRDSIIEHILEIISEFNMYSNNMDQTDISFLGYNLKKYTRFIINNSDAFKVRILNCLVSQLLSINVSNDFNLFKSNSRTLQYFELRILIYVRNYHCEFKKVLVHIENILEETKKYNMHDKIDYSILEVLNIFIKYVKNPEHIDNLILTHKYVMSVWKNGSKNLYFYTLHNQEHSVELIRAIVSICKSIDFFKIKPIDYYVLFLSCYLHDISMILQPDYNLFIADEYESDILFIQWMDKYKKIINEDNLCDKRLIKKFILDCYKKMDNYFENEVRSKHAKTSADFIKSTKDLDYIDSIVKDTVADVSRAHGFYTQDVYGVKSTGQSEIINMKFLMILLRLADLMDMSKDRVSLNIMKLNIDKMSKDSQFHWISHAAIDSCNIQAKYHYTKENEDVNNDIITFLDKSFFNESIEVNLYLNTENLTSMESKECINVQCTLDSTNDELSLKISNKVREKVTCDGECNLMCRWMCKKNEYLINELIALNKYLSRNKDNNFNTEIYFKIHMRNTNSIPQEYIETVLEYI